MKRGMQIALVIVSLVGFVTSASAGSGKKSIRGPSNFSTSKKQVVPQANFQKLAQGTSNTDGAKKRVVPPQYLQKYLQGNNNFGSLSSKKRMVAQTKVPQYLPLGPQARKGTNLKSFNPAFIKGSLTVHPTTTTPTNPSTPGQIQLGDRWGKAKALQQGTALPTNNPLGSKRGASGWVTVSIDSFPVSNLNPGGKPISNSTTLPAGKPREVRDHRDGAPQGGITVTNTPGGGYRGDVVGSGGSPIDTVVGAIVDLFDGSDFTPGSLPLDQPRDHRTQTYGSSPYTGPGGWEK